VPVGCLATAILVVNNVRDIDTDRRAGKLTLAVRLGRRRARVLYAALVVAAYVGLPIALLLADGPAWGLLALASLPLAPRPLRAVRMRTDGPSLNAALAATGALLAAFSALITAGLLLATA
jgi:1,4-dihydroxy-2-naphthoate polyprenyltransferase